MIFARGRDLYGQFLVAVRRYVVDFEDVFVGIDDPHEAREDTVLFPSFAG